MENVSKSVNTKRSGRSIIQYDSKMNMVRKWGKIKDVAEIGLCTKNIARSCKTGMLSHGFYWKYDNEFIEDEKWKEFEHDGRKIKVSSHGRFEMYNGWITRGTIDYGGYYRIKIEGKTYYAHVLVGLCFFPENKTEIATQINHINGKRGDNRLENLEWISPQGNSLHSHQFLNRKTGIKPIIQYDKNMNIVGEFTSAKAISEKYGIKPCNIYAACNGKHKTTNCMIFRYKDQVQE